MSLSDKKIALGLTLKIKDGDKIIEVPLSDFIYLYGRDKTSAQPNRLEG